MNQREARALREAAKHLRIGPGNGWQSTLKGDAFPDCDRTPEERTESIMLWLRTWVLPPIDSAVERYAKKRRKHAHRP